jgi:hypothetical protein
MRADVVSRVWSFLLALLICAFRPISQVIGARFLRNTSRNTLISVWYRDAIIDSPPDSGTTNTKRRRDFHQPLEYEKRWFGPFDSWLQKLTTVRSGDTVSRNYHVRGNYHSVL